MLSSANPEHLRKPKAEDDFWMHNPIVKALEALLSVWMGRICPGFSQAWLWYIWMQKMELTTFARLKYFKVCHFFLSLPLSLILSTAIKHLRGWIRTIHRCAIQRIFSSHNISTKKKNLSNTIQKSAQSQQVLGTI